MANKNDEKFPINFIYFHEDYPFEECLEFMENMKTLFNINVIYYNPKNLNVNRYEIMKEGLKFIIEEHKMKAIILGTRRTDPWASHQTNFTASDSSKGWPSFMRVNPILDWRYKNVWDFLKT